MLFLALWLSVTPITHCAMKPDLCCTSHVLPISRFTVFVIDTREKLAASGKPVNMTANDIQLLHPVGVTHRKMLSSGALTYRGELLGNKGVSMSSTHTIQKNMIFTFPLA